MAHANQTTTAQRVARMPAWAVKGDELQPWLSSHSDR
jgi:hypothetical protein